MYKLNIQPTHDNIFQYYKNNNGFHVGDAGFDLYVPEDIIFKPYEVKFIDFQIRCEMIDSNNNYVSYYLYPRSSISKTPLIMANCVGIIDAGYRGNIIGALRYIPFKNTENEDYCLKKNTRILQICSPNLSPFDTEIVTYLSETTRGQGGFGSTGN